MTGDPPVLEQSDANGIGADFRIGVIGASAEADH